MHIGGVNHLQIFYMLRSLHTVSLLKGELTKGLIEYIVKRGYDSDDLLQLSSKKGGYRRAIQLISIVSESYPEMKNKHFLNHVNIFARNSYIDLPPM